MDEAWNKTLYKMQSVQGCRAPDTFVLGEHVHALQLADKKTRGSATATSQVNNEY